MIKPTNQQIVAALNYLNTEAADNNIVKTIEANKIIDNPYNGYIASFGGSVVQMGLFPAVMLYHNDKRSGTCRQHITNAIFKLYKENHPGITEGNLFDFMKAQVNGNDLRQIRNEIMNIAVALKMAIRTFELKDLQNTTVNE